MDSANTVTERTSQVDATTLRMNTGSRNFSDRIEKYLPRAISVKI
jgi:hypothetical protein